MAKRSWSRDRNRQLKLRANAEEVEAKIAEYSARPQRKVPSPLSKADLRVMGEKLVQEFMAKRTKVSSKQDA